MRLEELEKGKQIERDITTVDQNIEKFKSESLNSILFGNYSHIDVVHISAQEDDYIKNRILSHLNKRKEELQKDFAAI